MPLLNAIRLGFLVASTPWIALGSSTPARPSEPPQLAIVKAVAGAGDVWLLGEDGSIFTVDERADTRRAIALPEPARDLCGGSAPVALTSLADAATGWTVRRWRNGDWAGLASIGAEADQAIGLTCDDAGVTLLTSKRLVQIDATGERTVKLSGDTLRPARVSSTLLSTPEAIYLGRNDGEWGGGLYRIDRRSGRIAAVENNASSTLCGGPLNGACDPVNGLVRDPWKPGCIIASIGLVHMAPHGRIVEVCGTGVRRLYFRVHPEAIKYEGAAASKPQGGGNDEPFSTEAFYGMVERGNDVWVAGTAGLYRFNSAGPPEINGLPPFRSVGGVQLSNTIPGLTLILTDINGKASLSGAVPLMIAADRTPR